MPYKAKQDDRCPASKPWGVIKETDGALMGCHPSEEAAMEQVQALYANEPEARDDDEPIVVPDQPVDSVEQRSSSEWELRADDDNIRFVGYAAVWDSPSEPMPFVETFKAGAFRRSLGVRRIPLLMDHDPSRMLASTKARTLRLAEDERGLRVEADLAPTSYGRDLKILADRGEIESMSFAFKPTREGEAWSDDGRTRTVSDARLFEVSILTGNAPAYKSTSAYVRSIAERYDEDPDALESAIDALREGRSLTSDEVVLLRRTIADLAPDEVVPFGVHQRRLTLMTKQP